MTAKEYQLKLLMFLGKRLPELEIRNEWNAFAGFSKQYLPRVDIAVGPFNIGEGPNLLGTYDHLVNKQPIKKFINSAIEVHRENQIAFDRNSSAVIHNYEAITNSNRNARCLLAIEIENTNSKKHMMGSIINAASLGRIGIGVAYCESALKTFLRILAYLRFLKSVGKNTYDTTNFLVLTNDQVNELTK
jgi:hypothetical protein